MKGVILAGGLGTRLFPLTKITNKHLLPVYDRPMIYYPIETLVRAGIDDIMIVTGGRKAGDFLSLLGNGSDFGLKHLNYTYQEGEGGIAQALGLCEHWAKGDSVCVVLGDNLIEKNIRKAVSNFREQKKGGKILLKEVGDPERFGVATIQGDKVVKIVEKPKAPESNLAVIGIYMYDGRVFDIIKTLKPSNRGELEITDVNNWYIQDGSLTWEVLEGWWTDAGTFKSLHAASTLIAQGAPITSTSGRVLVTGAAGMLGSELRIQAPPGTATVGTDLRAGEGVDAPSIDLADAAAVARLFGDHGPFSGVIHCAAFTAVDLAEEKEADALRANEGATRVLAQACAKAGTPLVVVGTDFVFDGESRRPYREDDPVRPLSAYGRTKLASERAALAAHPQGTRIVRTQWLYGPRGKHFPGTIRELARTRKELKVVSDQIGSPTTTLELAPALWDVLLRGQPGIWHAACEGSCSWFDLAVATLELCGVQGVDVRPCSTAEFPRPAKRPAYSVLDCTRLAALRGATLAPWKRALADFLAGHPL